MKIVCCAILYIYQKCSYRWQNTKYFDWEQLLNCCATSLITNMNQNCKYFSYVHKHYFLKIKKVLVLFYKISSFCLMKKGTPPPKSFVQYNCVFFPCFWCAILCLMALSMSSIRYQHPLCTLMQILSYIYMHVLGTK